MAPVRGSRIQYSSPELERVQVIRPSGEVSTHPSGRSHDRGIAAVNMGRARRHQPPGP